MEKDLAALVTSQNLEASFSLGVVKLGVERKKEKKRKEGTLKRIVAVLHMACASAFLNDEDGKLHGTFSMKSCNY